ncbi:unannotated protein [freshwater metagenome]|uniref:Unannotated protein n=1 Tax=freshwater metagenome TaxID=449393 RepID=A0A6J7T0F3_9ZZZZ
MAPEAVSCEIAFDVMNTMIASGTKIMMIVLNWRFK